MALNANIIALHHALNELENAHTTLLRTKNSEKIITEQEALCKQGIEQATKTVSSISPATDPNYENTLQKAQEDLMKRTKALDQILSSKSKQQIELKNLEEKTETLSRTVQDLKEILGATHKTYSDLFIEISDNLKKQSELEINLKHAEANFDPNEDPSIVSKKQNVIQELNNELMLEQKKLKTLEIRVEKGEALFSDPPTIITKQDAPTTDTVQNKKSLSIISLFKMITGVPALYVASGHKAYYKQCIKAIHLIFAFGSKTKAIFKPFMQVTWMSLFAPFYTIFIDIFTRIVYGTTKPTEPMSFVKWLNPLTLLKAFVGSILGLVMALISLPFTTLGAVVTLIIGIIIALLCMVSILLIEIICIFIFLILCLIASASKGLYITLKHYAKI